MAQAYDSKGYDRMMVNGLREYYDALTYERRAYFFARS